VEKLMKRVEPSKFIFQISITKPPAQKKEEGEYGDYPNKGDK
jgi:hypothetical protein